MPAIPDLRIGAGVTLALAVVASLLAAWYYWPTAQFNEDGSHIAVTELLRASIVDDPDDYEHIKTRTWNHPDGFLLVLTSFRWGKTDVGWVIIAVDRWGTIEDIRYASDKYIFDRLKTACTE